MWGVVLRKTRHILPRPPFESHPHVGESYRDLLTGAHVRVRLGTSLKFVFLALTQVRSPIPPFYKGEAQVRTSDHGGQWTPSWSEEGKPRTMVWEKRSSISVSVEDESSSLRVRPLSCVCKRNWFLTRLCDVRERGSPSGTTPVLEVFRTSWRPRTVKGTSTVPESPKMAQQTSFSWVHLCNSRL